MATITAKKIADMEAQRRKLDREIRSAKRAEAAAAKQALLSARQALGVWLTESVGADTTEAVERLRAALDTDEVRAHLASKVSAESPDTSAQGDDADRPESSDTSGAQHEAYGGRDA